MWCELALGTTQDPGVLLWGACACPPLPPAAADSPGTQPVATTVIRLPRGGGDGGYLHEVPLFARLLTVAPWAGAAHFLVDHVEVNGDVEGAEQRKAKARGRCISSL